MTKIKIPKVVFGTSCLGNLYKAVSYEEKIDIVREFIKCSDLPVMLDSAGKYGAGLSLKMLGQILSDLKVPSENVKISNKLGWLQVPLATQEPTFEPGIWKDLKNDAIQKISYEGIMQCFSQGAELLGNKYKASFVSVHDPDEYLSAAQSELDKISRLKNVIDGYKALDDLKKSGHVEAVGIGSKDWHVIKMLDENVNLDWVMLACSLTIMTHPPELLAFIESLRKRGVAVINSAVFHSGFLTGGEFFDYKKVEPEKDKALFVWRDKFHELCREFEVKPAAACVCFGMSVPGVVSTALNTSNSKRVRENTELTQSKIPEEFWIAMKENKLIEHDYPYLGKKEGVMIC